MKRKTFVLALGLLVMSTPCVFAQNKGKQVGKAVEAAVTKKVPKAPKAPRVSTRVPAVKTPASPTAPRVPTVRSMVPVSAADGAQVAPRLNAAQLAEGIPIARTSDGRILKVSVSIITRTSAVEILTQQAKAERIKLHQESDQGGAGVVVNDEEWNWRDEKGNIYVPPTPADYEEYAQAVRNMLLPKREQMMKEEGAKFLQEEFGGKTYDSALELAEDIAMYNLRVEFAPPCFNKVYLGDAGIGYVLELPAEGMRLAGDEGTKQILDPKTQVVFYQPDSEGIAGKTASVINRSDLEKPSQYMWRSPRPTEKFAAENEIPRGYGWTLEETRAFYKRVQEEWSKRRSKRSKL